MHCLFWLGAWMRSIFSILTSSSFCNLHKGRTRGSGEMVEVGGGVDFRATGRLRKAIMSARGCLGCKLLPVQR